MKSIPNRYRKKINKAGILSIVIPVAIFTMLLFIFGSFITTAIETIFYHRLESNSLKLAESYSFTVQKSEEARSIIYDFFDEKIEAASTSLLLYDGTYGNEELQVLADQVGVDVIYLYDDSETIVYSSSGEYIGWKPYIGHPAYKFMENDVMFHVESVRPDSESKERMKFGYVKLGEGWMAQLGIKAETVESFLDSFDIAETFDQLLVLHTVDRISYLNMNYQILESTDKSQLFRVLANPSMMKRIEQDTYYAHITPFHGVELYEVFVPIYSNGEKKGILAVGQSLEPTKEAVDKVVAIGATVLVLFYLLLVYIVALSYSKNKELRQVAYYDSKTGIPNIYYLKGFLEDVLKNEPDLRHQLVLINLKNIMSINKIYGLDHADMILQVLVERILDEMNHEKMTLFRVSAGRFALFLNRDVHLEPVLDSLVQTLEEPVVIGNEHHHLQGQLLVIPLDSGYKSADRIFSDGLAYLDQMMSLSFRDYRVLDSDLDRAIKRESAIEAILKEVINDPSSDKLYLEFQPELDAVAGKVICFEALSRIRSNDLGIVPPIEFIELAERKHIMDSLGGVILKKACKFIKQLEMSGFSHVKVAVNISAVQFMREAFVEQVLSAIKLYNVNPSQLELEITESIFMTNFDQVNFMLNDLKSRGISIALDDFGTGYSSFYKLEELNIDKVKIDRYFIQKITVENNLNLIVGDIISMAHKMGLTVTAEGVENSIQKAYLKSHDCDSLQGYYIGRPLSAYESLSLIDIVN